MEQNPKAARAVCRPIQLGSLGVRKAMTHAAACGLCAVAEKPGVARVGRGLRGEGDHLSRSKDRRVHGERGHRAVRRRKMRRLRAVACHQRQIGIRGRAALPVLHIVEGHVRHVAGHRGIGQRRLVQRPDVAEGDAPASRGIPAPSAPANTSCPETDFQICSRSESPWLRLRPTCRTGHRFARMPRCRRAECRSRAG